MSLLLDASTPGYPFVCLSPSALSLLPVCSLLPLFGLGHTWNSSCPSPAQTCPDLGQSIHVGRTSLFLNAIRKVLRKPPCGYHAKGSARGKVVKGWLFCCVFF